MANDDAQTAGGRLEHGAVRALDAAAGALQERRVLSGVVAGIVVGALATAAIGIATGAGDARELDAAGSRIAQLELENADLRGQIATGATTTSGDPDASGEAAPGDMSSPSSVPGAPELYRVGNAPLRLEDGQCADPDNRAEDWGVKQGAGDGLLCFASAGDNDRFVVNAAQIVNSTRYTVSDQYTDCEPDGEASGFVELEIDRYDSRRYSFCFTTGAGRTGHATVLTPETDPDDFDGDHPAYVDVLLKIWDDAQ